MADLGLCKLRKMLNSNPEISGSESMTIDILKRFIFRRYPDAGFLDLEGGSFLAYNRKTGPKTTIIVRSDIDAVRCGSGPDSEAAHLCGHDGHAAVGAAVAVQLFENCMDAAVLFQCSEENGRGAEQAIRSFKTEGLKPSVILGHHNIPGVKQGTIVMKSGLFALASTGLLFSFRGKEAHASEPEKGISPYVMMQELVSHSQEQNSLHCNDMITMTHFELGKKNAFGISPGSGTVSFTLRSPSVDAIDTMVEDMVRDIEVSCRRNNITVSHMRREPFPETVNNAFLYDRAMRYFREHNDELRIAESPFPWSEDFGHYSSISPSLFFGIGTGVKSYPLHHPYYEYPDALLEPSVRTFLHLIDLFLHDN